MEKNYKINELAMNRSTNIEYFYAFDVHCNSFVLLYCCVSSVQYIFLPMIDSNSFISIIISNTLYAAGIILYCLATTMGYTALPFIQKGIKLRKVLWGIVIFFAVLTLLGINLSKVFLGVYLSIE